MFPQRLLVPLFQRRYVWGEEHQWEPLWRDLERLAERSLTESRQNVAPHFIGAIVLQSLSSKVGDITEHIIIDGQQRLTTIQLLLDAIHLQAEMVGATQASRRLEVLITNDESYCDAPEDRFKVWPTNQDRPAFNEVMGASPPFDHDSLEYKDERLVRAHAFFSRSVAEFINAQGPDKVTERVAALERSARELLQVVVIQLDADENAQEIFETLNARGSLLTAADLIKNFIFQRLLDEGADVGKIYHTHWQEYETAFWEREVYSGTTKYQVSSLFLNHWLNAHTSDEFTLREVFTRFKRYALDDTKVPMLELLQQIGRAAQVYRSFLEASSSKRVATNRYELFAYRMGVLDVDQIRIVVMWLLDPELQKSNPIAPATLDRCWDLLETWVVRRVILRLSTKAMSKTFKELLRTLEANERTRADEVIERFMISQTAAASYLPDNEELRRELTTTPTYKRMLRTRLRMILEAVEDHMNGYRVDSQPLSAGRVPVAMLTIEHLMPQQWEMHWDAPLDENIEQRQIRIHQLGNLTLMRQALNSSVSNGPWVGDKGKFKALQTYGHLTMAMSVIRGHSESWTDEDIAQRTNALVSVIQEIWSVPDGYRSQHLSVPERPDTAVDISDLLAAGLLTIGQKIIPTWTGFDGVEAFITSDGRIDLNGELMETLSGAGKIVRSGKATNGWTFWAVVEPARRTLHDIRREYKRQLLGEEVDDDEDVDGGDGSDGLPTALRETQYRFWEGFRQHVFDSGASFAPRSAMHQNWMNISIGQQGVHITAIMATFGLLSQQPGPELRVEFYITNDHALYDRLYDDKEQIESAYGNPLSWHAQPANKTRKIFDHWKVDVTDEDRWPEYYDWLIDRIVRMRDVMKARL